MKLILYFASVFVALCMVPGSEAEWRSTSVKAELHALKEIFKEALTKYEEVYARVAENCPPCPESEKCDDGCLTKQLAKFEERLRRLLSVIAKLEKLACRECPGEFWTNSVVPDLGLPSGTDPPAPAPAPVFRNLHPDDLFRIRNLSPSTMKNQLNGLLGNLKSVMTATNGHLYLEQPQSSNALKGQPRGISYDSTTGDVYVAEVINDGDAQITRRKPLTGAVTKQVKTYFKNSLQPIDLTMYGDKLAVLLTNETHSSIELINVNTDIATTQTTFRGVGRRLVVNPASRVIYYTSDIGVYQYDISSGNTHQISNAINAIGIAYDSTGDRLYYCFSDNGTVSTYVTKTGSSSSEAKNNNGCSDLALHYVKDIFGSQPLSESLHIYIVSDTKSEVTEYLPSDPNGVPRMQNHFTADGGTSITLIAE